MKIAFVISSLNTGGAQRVLSNMITNFPDDWEMDLILNSAEKICYPYKGNIISLNMKEPKNRQGLFYQVKVFLKRFVLLKKLKKENYDYCISFLESANVVNIMTGTRKCKVIVTVHNTISMEMKGHFSFFFRHFIKYLMLFYNKAYRVVAVSKGVSYDLREHFHIDEKKLLTICNGIDGNAISKKMQDACNLKFLQNDGEDVIVTMGRLENVKGHWHLIRAFKKVVEKTPDAKLIILGDGKLKSYLEQLIGQLDLKEHVFLSGFQENPFPILQKSKLFVLSSFFEGLPMVLLEAMCCGLPCVCCDCTSGPREILAPDTDDSFVQKHDIEYGKYGVLVPMCSGNKISDGNLESEEELLADAIIELIKDKELYMKYKSDLSKSINSYLIENIAQEWMEFLENGV